MSEEENAEDEDRSDDRQVPEDDEVEIHEDGSASWTVRSDGAKWHVTLGLLEGYEPAIKKQREWLKKQGERS